MDDDTIEYRLVTTADTSGATAEAAALDKVTAATGKLADESEHYQKALEEMAAAQAMAAGKRVSEEDAGMMQRAEALKAEIALRKEASAQVKGDVINVTEAEAEAALASGAAYEETGRKAGLLTLKKQELKKMAGELAREFPLLGQAARVALNPIVGAVMLVMSSVRALSAAFADIQARLNTGIFAGTFLADADKLKQAATDSEVAFRGLTRELKAVADAQSSVKLQTEGAIDAVRAQNVAELELQNAEKARDIAAINLAEKQGKLTGPQAIAARMRVEGDYSRKALDAKFSAGYKELELKQKQLVETENAARWETQYAEEAKQGLDEAQRDQARFTALLEGSKKALADTKKQTAALRGTKLLTPGWQAQLRSSEDLEQQLASRIATLEPQGVDYADRAAAAQAQYSARAKRAVDLTGQAAALRGQLPGEEAIFAAGYRADARRLQVEGQTRAFTAGGEITGALNQAQEKQTQLQQEIARSIEANGQATAAMIEALRRQTALVVQAKQEMDSMRGQIGGLRAR